MIWVDIVWPVTGHGLTIAIARMAQVRRRMRRIGLPLAMNRMHVKRKTDLLIFIINTPRQLIPELYDIIYT
jgi:hypothetical protein